MGMHSLIARKVMLSNERLIQWVLLVNRENILPELSLMPCPLMNLIKKIITHLSRHWDTRSGWEIRAQAFSSLERDLTPFRKK